MERYHQTDAAEAARARGWTSATSRLRLVQRRSRHARGTVRSVLTCGVTREAPAVQTMPATADNKQTVAEDADRLADNRLLDHPPLTPRTSRWSSATRVLMAIIELATAATHSSPERLACMVSASDAHTMPTNGRLATATYMNVPACAASFSLLPLLLPTSLPALATTTEACPEWMAAEDAKNTVARQYSQGSWRVPWCGESLWTDGNGGGQ